MQSDKRKRRRLQLIRAAAVLVILGGLAAVMYPFLSNYLFDHRSDSQITAYTTDVEAADDGETERLLQEARDYNARLTESTVELTDPFVEEDVQEDVDEYYNILNINDSGVMGYIDIPVIGVYLPIFHGTAAETLEAGVGHLEGSSFPVGGASTHAVLTGHTGLSSAKLFTDLIAMEVGDYFCIHILNELLFYRVDQILVVEPEDTSALHIISDMDYVTLVTCTPYGINTHRLLVRGVRVPDEEGLAILYPESDTGDENAAAELAALREQQHRINSSLWMREYRNAVLAGIGGTAAALLLLTGVKRIRKRKRGEQQV